MPGGRPTLYRDEYAEQATKLCKLGATDEDMAQFFGVDVSTIGNWKHAHPEFFEAIRAGKAIADMEVAESLHSRALGHTWVEQQAFKVKRADGSEAVEVVEVERQVPPDATSMVVGLKNRRKQDWRDRHTLDGDPDNPVVTRIETVVVDAQSDPEN